MTQRRQNWVSPDPTCVFVVACTGNLPSILDVVTSESGGSVSRVGSMKEKPIETPMEPGAGYGVFTPERGMISVAVAGKPPPLPVTDQPAEWAEVGLNEELAQRLKDARHSVLIRVEDPGTEVVGTVRFATSLADRISTIATGCVDDMSAQRFFAGETWKADSYTEGFDPSSHISLHLQPAAPKGLWLHTHGLIKFGRAELEMRAVPQELLKEATQTVLNFASYVVEEREIRPGHTVGNPDAPLIARVSRPDPEHWEGAPALELVDVDRSNNPVPIGVERGLRAMIWA